MRFLALILAFLITPIAHAGFWLQPSIHYSTDTDDVTNLAYSASHYNFILGATFGKKGNWVVGQSIVSWTRAEGSDNTDPENDISMMELGPRIMFMFGRDRNFYISGTYNFYAKGTRNVDGSEYDISGSSVLGAFGVQMKASKTFYLGFSITYHATTIIESSVDTTKEEVSNSYTRIYPAFEFSLRFK